MREIQPPDASFPKPFMTAEVSIGRPIRVDYLAGRDSDRRVLRQLIDEVMFEIRELSGQDYVDRYANAPVEEVDVMTSSPPVEQEPSPTLLEDRRSSASVLASRPLAV